MRELTVHAGWEDNAVIGKIYIQEIRGKEKFMFEYEPEWLKKHADLLLDPDIKNCTGIQYVPTRKEVFGFISDVSPDRWGRKLLQRSFEENSAPSPSGQRRKVLESDNICCISDKTRQGGIRLAENGSFLSDRESSVPAITSLRELEAASMRLEKHEGNIDKILQQLLACGSSLGGARPKANVKETDNSLWIAKFPSKDDDIDVGAWEMVIHDLAVKCGLNVPDAKLARFSEYGSTFIVKRFDREKDGESRRHFMSAMTMLGQTDNSDDISSYLDIADKIDRQKSDRYLEELSELWHRVVFNICVSNTDDHLRNHGFLLNPQNDLWELSPAYDMNPVPYSDRIQLAIDFNHTAKDLKLALAICNYYYIETDTAIKEIVKIQETIRENWRKLADKYHISKSEQDRMKKAFAQSDDVSFKEKTQTSKNLKKPMVWADRQKA